MIPMVGLAIDGANAYILRGQLSTALDAAVLAGARALGGNYDLSTQEGNATAFAQQVWNANVANLSSNIKSSLSFSPSVTEGANHYRYVNGTASADLPLSMMSMIGFTTAHVSLTAQAQRRDVNLILVLDNSYPLAGVESTLQSDATTFVNEFANGRDTLGLVTYTGAPFAAYPPSTTFLSDTQNIPYWISQAQPYQYAGSNMAAALWAAYQQLVTLNRPGALNAIVVFTGGLPNSLSGDFSQLIAAAGCNAPVGNPGTHLAAVLWGDPYQSFVAGLSDPTSQGPNDQLEFREAPQALGCSSLAPTIPYSQYPFSSGLPATDLNGNSTQGSPSWPEYSSGGMSSGMLTSYPSPNTVTAAAENAADYAAFAIRSDLTLTPVIYTIALFSLPDIPPDATLMQRIANDPNSPVYSGSQPSGLYFAAPTINDLNTVFTRVASQVIRLAQ
jgi:hypothetical protein